MHPRIDPNGEILLDRRSRSSRRACERDLAIALHRSRGGPCLSPFADAMRDKLMAAMRQAG